MNTTLTPTGFKKWFGTLNREERERFFLALPVEIEAKKTTTNPHNLTRPFNPEFVRLALEIRAKTTTSTTA